MTVNGNTSILPVKERKVGKCKYQEGNMHLKPSVTRELQATDIMHTSVIKFAKRGNSEQKIIFEFHNNVQHIIK